MAGRSRILGKNLVDGGQELDVGQELRGCRAGAGRMLGRSWIIDAGGELDVGQELVDVGQKLLGRSYWAGAR